MLRLCLLFLALAGLARAAAPPGPLPSHIAAWIEQLGDDSFEKREQASRLLRATGEPAEAALEKAVESGDAEVKRRARAIVADLKLGIYPGTPEKVADLARKYGGLAGNEKRPVIQGLLAAGAPGIRSLARLARAETDPIVRKDVFADIGRSVSRAIPNLLERKETLAIEALLDLGVQGNVNTGAGHYAAYWLLTGRLADKAAQLEARAKANPPGKAEQEVLFYLYRAAGDFKKARRAAIEAERLDLIEAILFENARWKELDADPKLVPDGAFAMQKGFRAAYARLAGNAKGHAQAIAELMEKARPLAKEQGDVLPFAKALFFNGKPGEAIDLLVTAKADPQLLFDVLVAQLRYKEAFAVAAAGESRKLEMTKARHQWLLGLKDEALAVLKKGADDLKAGAGADWPVELVETELAIGRRDEAWAAAAAILEAAKDEAVGQRVLGKLLKGKEQEAQAAWRVVRTMKGLGDARAQAAFLRALFEGRGTAAQVKELHKAAGDLAPAPEHPGEPAIRWLAVGTAARACKQDKLAIEAFGQGGIRGRVRIGDIRMKAKEHARAYEEYDAAYRAAISREDSPLTDGDEALPSVALYLSGKALVAAGRVAEGKARIERAHLLPLGDAEARHAFLKVLVNRNEKEAARREAELLSRLGDPVVTSFANYWTAEGIRNLSILRERDKQELAASDGFEAVFLGCLTPGVNFTRALAYVTVPSYLRKMRAIGLARAGRWDESKASAAEALAGWQGNLDVAIGLVPILEKAGRKKDADELYKKAQAPQEALLKEYPKSPLALNQLAWLGATCRRDPERAVEWARRAVAISPTTSAYHDTLAEALFQAGKKDEAAAAIKKAIALDPKRAYYRQMLRRIEAGDAKADLPAEDDED